jgi:hypothetical protein
MRRVNIVVLVEHIVRVNDIDGCGGVSARIVRKRPPRKGE